jgi:hypothetical protein
MNLVIQKNNRIGKNGKNEGRNIININIVNSMRSARLYPGEYKYVTKK